MPSTVRTRSPLSMGHFRPELMGRFGVDAAVDPEGHLLSRAAGLDIVGRDFDELSPDFRADVLRQHPRLGLAEEFLACFQARAERKADSSAAHAVQSGLSARMAGNPLDGERV
ncbi:hypothetical protein ACIBL3_30165 [Kribbella sp. NPDC050124]|uniref:hypothetical protein n=1 Tax=Kribbella sp. NPDC050124 TaxID=3364114 RepID=UPI0037892CB7